MSLETFRFEGSAGGWSPALSVIGSLEFDRRDVAAVFVAAAMVEFVRVILSSAGVGRNSTVVTKKLQDSQIGSKWQSIRGTPISRMLTEFELL